MVVTIGDMQKQHFLFLSLPKQKRTKIFFKKIEKEHF